MDIYTNIINQNKELTAEIAQLRKVLSSLPEETLGCYLVNGYMRFFILNENQKKYLSCKDKKTAKLVAKDYCLLRLKKCENELAANEAYLKTYKAEWSTLPERLNHASYRNMLAECSSIDLPSIPPSYKEMQEWMNASFESNPNHLDNLKHRFTDKIYMRSKSEVGIARILSVHNIPFRYECKLDLNGIIFYPDFTIMHPKTRQIFLWEHCGMIDDEKYLNNSLRKQGIYAKNGYYPGVNLILTYETKDHPLDLTYVENQVIFYFK